MAHPKLVFISGPYSSDDSKQKRANIEDAVNVAIWCARNRIHYFCPHMNSAYFDDLAPDVPTEFYYTMDTAILDRCDAIVMFSKYWHSEGAIAELKYASNMGKKYFCFDTEQENILKWHNEEIK